MLLTTVVLGFVASALSSVVSYLLGRKKQDASAAKDLIDGAMVMVVELRNEIARLVPQVAELKKRVAELEDINAQLRDQLHLRMNIER